MAKTQELKVKFKVDASEVQSGSNEAKNKVKDAAKTMESDVKNSSDAMKSSFEGVVKSTEKISDATKTASNSVKQMEQQVATSSKAMEQNVDSVAEKIKNISARQVAGLASRGANIMAGQIQDAIGDTEGGSMAAAALRGAGTGAMMGSIGGPIAAAAGALVGAATELTRAALEIKSAAQDRKIATLQNINAERESVIAERKRRYDAKEVQGYIDNLSVAESGESRAFSLRQARSFVEDKRREAEAAQQRYEETALNMKVAPGINAEAVAKAIEDAKKAAQEAADAYAQVAPLQVAIAQAEEQAKQELLVELQAIQKKNQAEADAIRAAEENTKAWEARAAQATEEDLTNQIINNLDPEPTEEDTKSLADLQSRLNGALSRSASTPSDSLTKIGGGVGYTDYNKSVESVQKTISDNLKTLIQNQSNQNTEIATKLDEIKDKIGGGSSFV